MEEFLVVSPSAFRKLVQLISVTLQQKSKVFFD
jgi:hypothetical protein